MNVPVTSTRADWLADMCQPVFEPRYLGREPFILTGIARSRDVCFDWSQFESVLASPDADVAVISRGLLLPCEPPCDLDQLKRYFSRGIGLTVQGAERHCPILRALGESVGRELGPARVHLSALPISAGFGWHYEDDHKFIIQLAGTKDYSFRPNTVASHVPASRRAFAAYSEEDSRLWTARLSQGDVLYLPASWWHKAECLQNSLSVSIGVRLSTAESCGGIDA